MFLPEIVRNWFGVMPPRIREMPLVVVMPYSGCNCRCVMCDYWKPDRGEKSLSPGILSHQMESFRHLRVRWVLLSGGEPLMHPDIWDICGMMKALPARTSLLTNGLLLGTFAKEIIRHCDDVIVSLDGSRDVHDRVRGFAGAFDRLARGVEAIRKLEDGFRITARCVLQKANYLELSRIIKTARDLGLDSLSFFPIDVSTGAFNRPGPCGDRKIDQLALSMEEIAEFRYLLAQTIKEYGKEFRSGFIAESPGKLRRLVRYFSALKEKEPFPPHSCNAPWVSTVIEADGTVRPCFFHEPFGNIHEDTLENIVNSHKAVTFRQNLRPKKNATCVKCVCPLYMRPGKIKKT